MIKSAHIYITGYARN